VTSIIGTENTIKAVNMLNKYTDKAIQVRDIKELPDIGSYLGAAYIDDEIIIHLNCSYPIDIQEATFIHEVLHLVLRYEGFPKVEINETIARTLPSQFISVLPKLRSHFSSTIEHPQIFKRMESEFTLNLPRYYGVQVQQKLNRLNKGLNYPKGSKQYYFFRQQDILIGLEYFFYPQYYKNKILSVFKEAYPNAYTSCLSLYNKVKKIGFNSPKSAYESAKIIKAHVIRYGRRKSVGVFNKMWKALEI